jgi:hypothetical protein
MRTKYIVTKDNVVVVFPDMLQHAEFKHMKPISAGFIEIFADDNGDVKCDCYGESVSLELKSRPDIDKILASKQILHSF